VTQKTKILFVCLGNIIRSPLAEHMFARMAETSGLNGKYEVDSAGTSDYHVGEEPDRRMRKAAASYGLVYTGEARQFRPQDFDEFDLIIPQDTSNLEALRRMARRKEDIAKLHTMRSFDPQGGAHLGVPDPYYGGVDGFHETYEIVRRSCQGLINALESGELEA
jgi:protein-tyrosine phosphatase